MLDYGLQQYLARVAVPFYFIASGYFLFRKTSYTNFDAKIPLKYACRIFRLYVIWTIIYFPYVLRDSILWDKNGIAHGLLIWIRNCIFTGSYLHLWYLNATVVATLILTFCLSKKMKMKTILCIATIMYIIGLLPQTYFVFLEPLRKTDVIWSFLKLIQNIIVTTRNGFFEGFLFMGIGMVFAYKPIVMKFKTAVAGFICSMVLFFFEAILVRYLGEVKNFDMYAFLVPVTFFLFYIVMHVELNGSIIYKHLRELGVLIFYLHLFISPFVEQEFLKLGIDNSLLKYCCTILVTGMVSQCIIVLSNKENFRWLKKIYL